MSKQSERSCLLFLVISVRWHGAFAPHFPEITWQSNMNVHGTLVCFDLKFHLMKFECSLLSCAMVVISTCIKYLTTQSSDIALNKCKNYCYNWLCVTSISESLGFY